MKKVYIYSPSVPHVRYLTVENLPGILFVNLDASPELTQLHRLPALTPSEKEMFAGTCLEGSFADGKSATPEKNIAPLQSAMRFQKRKAIKQ